MAGRRPKPTNLKLLTGNPGRRPLNSQEPQPDQGIPDMPAGLSHEAQEEWKQIVPILSGMRVLTVADYAALGAYCEFYAAAADAGKHIQEHGAVIDEPICNRAGDIVGYRMKKNPAVAIRSDAAKHMRAFLSDFGLSPAARTKVHAAGAEAPRDPLEDFLNDDAGDGEEPSTDLTQ